MIVSRQTGGGRRRDVGGPLLRFALVGLGLLLPLLEVRVASLLPGLPAAGLCGVAIAKAPKARPSLLSLGMATVLGL